MPRGKKKHTAQQGQQLEKHNPTSRCGGQSHIRV